MPKITLTSYGAAQEVTGSCHLLKVDNFKILIDCGWWQGDQKNYFRNWEAFGFDAKSLNAVILTHAHLDHCGRLPLLYARGYKGEIYSTKATQRLAQIVLEDSFNIMLEKASQHSLGPAYKKTDLDKLNQHWTNLDYYKTTNLNNDIKVTLHNAGHILGSSLVEIKAGPYTIVFTGDMGAENMPLVKNIDYLKTADAIVMESTYGDRNHEAIKDRNAKLLEAVQRVTKNGSTLIISVFAVERAQNILKVLNDYYENHLDFRVPVFLDSPMAAEVTKVYRENSNYLNPLAQDELKHDRDIFSFPHLKVTSTVEQSKKINSSPNPKIILAGSGMADGGRILHHLANFAPDPKNHILFMGFQVPGTLGYKLTNGAFDFRYFDRQVSVRAGVDKIDAFSAHADQNALMKWLGAFKNKPKIFLVHGDPSASQVFADKIKAELQLNAEILKNQNTINLN